ncbi:MAG: hypothetical protein WBV94_31830 [Blastocatellia bacterium]
MTSDNEALKQVTADDIGGFVNTVHALFKHDELGKGTKDQFDDALRAIGNDFGAGDIVGYVSMTNWLFKALSERRQEQPAPEAEQSSSASQCYFDDNEDVERFLDAVIEGDRARQVETLAEFALQMTKLLKSGDADSVKAAFFDCSSLLSHLFNRTETYRQAFRLFKLRYSIPGTQTPEEFLKTIIDQEVEKSEEVKDE